jgi:predicted DNA-binding transcriptional regulator AlpA
MSDRNTSQLPDEGFVRLDGVLRVYPVSRSHWYEGVRSGRYPQPVKLSERITAWRASDIRKLINPE